MLEPEQLLDDGQFSGGGGFSPLSVDRLAKASGWINFLSILFYTLCILMAIFFIIILITEGGRGNGGDVLSILFGFGFVGVGFIIARQLQALAKATRQLRYGGATAHRTNEVCAGLRRVFSTFGTMFIVCVILGIVGYVIAVNQTPYYY